MFDDEAALRNRDQIGMSQLCFEVDYPHGDSTFPHTVATAQHLAILAELSPAEVDKLFRRNAIELLDLGARYGSRPSPRREPALLPITEALVLPEERSSRTTSAALDK